MTSTPLATLDASPLRQDGDVLGFDYQDRLGRDHKGLVIRWNDELKAYRNLCPHWSTPLDEDGDRLFDHGSRALICQTHGALFEPASGQCISGPCFGEALKELRVERAEGSEIEIFRAGLVLSES